MSDKNNRKIADIYWAVSTQDSSLHSLSHLILTTTGEVLFVIPILPCEEAEGQEVKLTCPATYWASKWHSQDLTPESIFLTLSDTDSGA